jgi:hypothetical protein
MIVSFKEALRIVLKDRDMTAADREHIARWLADGYADDPIWEKLAAPARSRNLSPPDSIHENIIRESLYNRSYAESVKSGIDFELRERQRQHKRDLDLAQGAENLADYYKWAADYPGIADFFIRFLKPVGDLEALHRREAVLLRQRAGRPPVSAARISRQDRRGHRKGLRKVIAFIDLTAAFMGAWISEKPDYEAIALLAEIAFPDHEIDADDVRKAMNPTTRSGRKRVRAHAPRKSKRVRVK